MAGAGARVERLPGTGRGDRKIMDNEGARGALRVKTDGLPRDKKATGCSPLSVKIDLREAL